MKEFLQSIMTAILLVAMIIFPIMPLVAIQESPRWVEHIAQDHHIIGFCLVIGCLAGAILVSAVLANRIDHAVEKNVKTAVAGIAVLTVFAVGCAAFLLLKEAVADVVAKLKPESIAVERVKAALSYWLTVWAILIAYMAKIPWDRFRGKFFKVAQPEEAMNPKPGETAIHERENGSHAEGRRWIWTPCTERYEALRSDLDQVVQDEVEAAVTFFFENGMCILTPTASSQNHEWTEELHLLWQPAEPMQNVAKYRRLTDMLAEFVSDAGEDAVPQLIRLRKDLDDLVSRAKSA